MFSVGASSRSNIKFRRKPGHKLPIRPRPRKLGLGVQSLSQHMQDLGTVRTVGDARLLRSPDKEQKQ